MRCKLLVIRTSDPEKLKEFYNQIGMNFDYHKHGNSPFHYSAAINGIVIEIYPLAKNQIEADPHLRLGFEIDNFDEIIELLRAQGLLLSEPSKTDYGTIAITKDPDGKKIELYKPE